MRKEQYTELQATILPRQYKNDYTVFVKSKNQFCFNFTCFRNKSEFETFKKFMGEYKLINQYGRIIYQFKRNIEINYFWDLEQIPDKLKKVVLLENGSRVVCFYKIENDTIQIYKPNCNSLYYKTHKLDYFKTKSFETEESNFIYDYSQLESDLNNYNALYNIIKR